MLCVTIGGGGRSHECHLCSGVLGPAELIRIEDELELSGKGEADAVVPDVAVALNAASTLTTAAQVAALVVIVMVRLPAPSRVVALAALAAALVVAIDDGRPGPVGRETTRPQRSQRAGHAIATQEGELAPHHSSAANHNLERDGSWRLPRGSLCCW